MADPVPPECVRETCTRSLPSLPVGPVSLSPGKEARAGHRACPHEDGRCRSPESFAGHSGCRDLLSRDHHGQLPIRHVIISGKLASRDRNVSEARPGRVLCDSVKKQRATEKNTQPASLEFVIGEPVTRATQINVIAHDVVRV